MPSVIGFHANRPGDCQNFTSPGSTFMVSCPDKDFLGPGMYFWNAFAHARWWAEEKKHKEGLAALWIVKAEIDTSAALDLMDPDIAAEVDRIWQILVRKAILAGIGLGGTRTPGKDLDVIFKFERSWDERYTIIVGYAPYRKMVLPGFFVNTRLDTKGRIIYCVRKVAAILSREKVCEL